MHDYNEVHELTVELRSSNAPRWKRLRDQLRQVGIAPEDAAVGTLFPDDTNLLFGVLATRDGKCIKFEFDFLRDQRGQPIHSFDDARVPMFEEMDRSDNAYTRSLSRAKDYLASERD